MRQPSPSEDPIAAKTQWTPLVPGGANFITDHLVEEGPFRLAMRPTPSMKLFGLAFLVTGLGCIVAGALIGIPFLLVFGLPLLVVGMVVLWHRTAVFDGQTRRFLGKHKEVAPFAEIHALQVVRETVSDAPDFDSFELNVVLTNGERINVIDHIGLVEVRADAQKLSALIGCKVWDASTG